MIFFLGLTLGLFCIFFIFGYFSSRTLFPTNDTSKSIIFARYLFSYTFALSCVVYLLVIFEILQFGGVTERWLTFKTALWIMIANLLIVLPFLQFYLFLDVGRYAKALSIILYVVYVFLIWKFVDPLEGESEGLFQSCLARISVIGVTINAILSGYSSVVWPLSSLGFLLSSGRDVSVLKQRLFRMIDSIAQIKKRILMEHKVLIDTPDSGYSFFSTSKAQQMRNNISTYEQQAAVTEDVANEIVLEINDAQETEIYDKFSLTIKGRLYVALGYVCSFYAIYRVLMSFVNLILNRDHSKKDPVQLIIQLISTHILKIEIDIDYVYHQVTFILTTMVIILSIRGFLLTMHRVFHAFLRNISDGFIMLFFAQLLGMYFTSSLTLLRLPFKQRQVLSDIFSIQFKFYQRWNDVFFILSVFVSVVFLFSRKKLKGESL